MTRTSPFNSTTLTHLFSLHWFQNVWRSHHMLGHSTEFSPTSDPFLATLDISTLVSFFKTAHIYPALITTFLAGHEHEHEHCFR